MKGFLNSRTFWIVICGIILFFSKISLGHNWPIKSYWEIRYKNVRGQNTLSSCGPASLATLFAEFYGMKTSEEEVIKLTKPYLEEEIEKQGGEEISNEELAKEKGEFGYWGTVGMAGAASGAGSAAGTIVGGMIGDFVGRDL